MTSSRDLSSAVCVVTGGLGFIGSNLSHELIRRGATVRIIDALVAGHGGDRRNVDGLDVTVVEAEIGDPEVADVVADADLVFNLAGQVSHIASMHDPLRDLHVNAVTHASHHDLTHATCPEAEAWAAECLSVPCFPEMTEAEIAQGCAALAGLAQ